jgi:hypothetical protein
MTSYKVIIVFESGRIEYANVKAINTYKAIEAALSQLEDIQLDIMSITVAYWYA